MSGNNGLNENEVCVLKMMEYRTAPGGHIGIADDIREVCVRLIGARSYEQLEFISKKKAADEYERIYHQRPL